MQNKTLVTMMKSFMEACNELIVEKDKEIEKLKTKVETLGQELKIISRLKDEHTDSH